MLPLRYTRTSQPSKSGRINYSNPLSQGLVSAWVPGNLTGAVNKPASGGAVAASLYGEGELFNGTSQSISLGANILTHGTGTRLALVRIGSASGSRNISAGGNSGTGFRINGTSVEIVNTGVAVTLAAASAVTANEYCCLAIAYAPFDSQIFKNGLSIASNSSSTGAVNNLNDFLAQNGTGSQYFDGTIFLHLQWNRRLTASEILYVSRNPWQVFSPTRVWVPSSIGGAGNIYTFSVSGGVALSGNSALLRTRLQPVSGGVTFSGAAPNIRERAVLPSGGVTFGGTAPVTDTSEYQFDVSGGITFSGSPVITKENVVTPSGGANFGGTARLIFVPVGGVGSNDSDRISVGVSRKVGVS